MQTKKMQTNGTAQTQDVVFAPDCPACHTDIMRSQKRKLIDGKWNHLDCLIQGDGGIQLIRDILLKNAKMTGTIDEGKVLEIVNKAIEGRLPQLIESEARRGKIRQA